MKATPRISGRLYRVTYKSTSIDVIASGPLAAIAAVIELAQC